MLHETVQYWFDSTYREFFIDLQSSDPAYIEIYDFELFAETVIQGVNKGTSTIITVEV